MISPISSVETLHCKSKLFPFPFTLFLMFIYLSLGSYIHISILLPNRVGIFELKLTPASHFGETIVQTLPRKDER